MKNDIALIRIDYPLSDEKYGKDLILEKESSPFFAGMTVMSVNNFGKRRLMPICLPSSSTFRDTIRGNTSDDKQGLLRVLSSCSQDYTTC